MKYYLALDWGKRKIGIATADDEVRIAYADSIVDIRDALDVIFAYISEQHVTDIVIGIPVHHGHKNAGAEAQRFAQRLAQRCPDVRIHIVDEMFTTKMAQRMRVVAGKSGGDDDAEAARILLQEWCDALER